MLAKDVPPPPKGKSTLSFEATKLPQDIRLPQNSSQGIRAPKEKDSDGSEQKIRKQIYTGKRRVVWRKPTTLKDTILEQQLCQFVKDARTSLLDGIFQWTGSK